MAGLMLGVLLSALDQMIIASALRTMADRLDGLTFQGWATTSYLITSVLSAPLYGKLSDLYGRKTLYLISISVFLVGSLLCALAGSMYELAAYRAFQGAGAGGLMPLALAILADLLSPEERVRHQAYLGSVFGIASIAGPVLGGFFAGTDSLLGVDGWRWAFLINLPLGLIALVIVARLFALPNRRVAQRVDYGGVAALILGLVPMLIVTERGTEWGWMSARSAAMIALGLAGLGLFVLVERRMGDAALLPPKLFRSRVFTLVNVINFVVGIGIFGGMLLLPLYLQLVKGLSPTAAGLMLLPQTAAILAASRIVGPIVVKTGRHREFLVLGVTAVAASAFAFAALGVNTPLWVTGSVTAAMGLGVGVFFQVVMAALQDGVLPRDIGVASGLFTFFRQIGGAAGTAILVSVVFGVVGDRITQAFQAAHSTPSFQAALHDSAVLADPANRPVVQSAQDGNLIVDMNDTSFLEDLDPRLAAPIIEGMSSAISTAFLIVGITLALAVFLPLLLGGSATVSSLARPSFLKPRTRSTRDDPGATSRRTS